MKDDFVDYVQVLTGRRINCNPNTRDGFFNVGCSREEAQAVVRELWKPGDFSLTRKTSKAEAVKNWTRPEGSVKRPYEFKRWGNPEEDEIVLSFPANLAAEKLGVSYHSVARRKDRLLREGRELKYLKSNRSWTPDEDKLFETMTKSEISDATGRSMVGVQSRREKLVNWGKIPR